MGKKNGSSLTVLLVWPFCLFMMHDREEWFPVAHGSQHKCVEQLVRTVLPDYLSVS